MWNLPFHHVEKLETALRSASWTLSAPLPTRLHGRGACAVPRVATYNEIDSNRHLETKQDISYFFKTNSSATHEL